MPSKIIRVGSRSSRLALTQARLYLDTLKLQVPGVEFEIIEIQTSGDRFGELSPQKVLEVSGKGIFVKEIEEAILSGGIDFAIHSLKDLPNACPKGLVLCGYQKREDPRDALISQREWQALPIGAVIGTSSLRRKFQLMEMAKARGLEFKFQDLRGNVDTRVKKVMKGDLDAVVLSHAGLLRLGLRDHVRYVFDPAQEMTPPCGQGTLVAQIRDDRADLFLMLCGAEDPQTRLASELERLALRKLGGGCLDALGIYARPLEETESSLELHLYRHSGKEGEAGLRASWKISGKNREDFAAKLRV